MTIRLEHIDSSDHRTTDQLHSGEVVDHQVIVSFDGRPRTFSVYLKANVLPGFDASLIHGDELLEEVLRFEPAALSVLYNAVGNYRRRIPVELPMVLVASTPGSNLQSELASG